MAMQQLYLTPTSRMICNCSHTNMVTCDLCLRKLTYAAVSKCRRRRQPANKALSHEQNFRNKNELPSTGAWLPPVKSTQTNVAHSTLQVAHRNDQPLYRKLRFTTIGENMSANRKNHLDKIIGQFRTALFFSLRFKAQQYRWSSTSDWRPLSSVACVCQSL